MKSGIKSAAKWLFYPFIRTAQDVGVSAKNTKENMELVRQKRKENEEKARQVSEYLEGMTRQEKFDHIREMNRWTEAELAKQLVAVRRTRLALLSFGVFGSFLVAGAVLAATGGVIPSFLLVLMGLLVVAMLLAACAAMALRFSWHEYSLKNREILPFAEFLKMGRIVNRLFY